MEVVEKKAENPTVYAPIIIDFGTQKRKHVKRLRKGRSGKLLDEVQECLEELKTNGAIDPSAQPVVIIIKEKRKQSRWW